MSPRAIALRGSGAFKNRLSSFKINKNSFKINKNIHFGRSTYGYLVNFA